MVRRALVTLALLFTTLACAAQVPGSMNIATINYQYWPNPAPSFMRARTGVSWPEIEPQRGEYSPTFRSSLDQWIATAKKNQGRDSLHFRIRSGMGYERSDLSADRPERCQ